MSAQLGQWFDVRVSMLASVLLAGVAAVATLGAHALAQRLATGADAVGFLAAGGGALVFALCLRDGLRHALRVGPDALCGLYVPAAGVQAAWQLELGGEWVEAMPVALLVRTPALLAVRFRLLSGPRAGAERVEYLFADAVGADAHHRLRVALVRASATAAQEADA